MTKNNSTKIIVRDIVNATPFWASDETLSQVRNRFKRLSGKFPSKKANIVCFSGSFEDLENININGLGDIQYGKNVTRTVIQ
jgi:hypothetical protein